CRLHNHICTVLNGAEQITGRSKSVVNDQRKIIFFCKGCKFFKVRYIQTGVANSFQVDGLGIFVDQWYETFGIIFFCKAYFNAKAFESNFELVVSTAVQVRCTDKVITSLQDIVQSQELRSLS